MCLVAWRVALEDNWANCYCVTSNKCDFFSLSFFFCIYITRSTYFFISNFLIFTRFIVSHTDMLLRHKTQEDSIVVVYINSIPIGVLK